MEEAKEKLGVPTNSLAAEPERFSPTTLLPKSDLYGIGLFSDKVDSLPDSDAYDLIKNISKPGNYYNFPAHSIYGKYRKFNLSLFQKFPWHSNSGSLDAAFCIASVFFGRHIGANASKLNKLMKNPFVDWSQL